MKSHDRTAVFTDIVKSSVTGAETGKALGLDIRKGRCRCPVHNGDGFNCSLSRTKPFFHCFVCGAKGDVFDLVRAVTDMPFPDILTWFNDTFRLGMDIDSPVDEKRLKTAKNRLKRKAEERRFRERIEQLDFDMYLAACTAHDRMEEQRDLNRPRLYSEDWNDQFAVAVEILPEVRSAMEYFAMESTVIRT